MSELDLSMVDHEQQPEPASKQEPTQEPQKDTRPRLIIAWDPDAQAPAIVAVNCKTFEMQIAMLAAAQNFIEKKCDEARNMAAQAAMMEAVQQQQLARQLGGQMPGRR